MGLKVKTIIIPRYFNDYDNIDSKYDELFNNWLNSIKGEIVIDRIEKEYIKE